jgi:acyl carrier protein phosphodiesterase
MNFLAHSLLGFDEEALIAGQIGGDFIRGRALSHLPVRVEAGVRLHRYLDVYTDAHPALVAARASLPGVPRRFAGIVIDVMFDHYLARQWSRFSPYTLDAHAAIVHSALATHRQVLPDSLQHFMPVMSRERILERNAELSAIALTLARIARRSVRFAPLAMDLHQLRPLRSHLQEPFESFYPELHAAARFWLDRRMSHTNMEQQS